MQTPTCNDMKITPKLFTNGRVQCHFRTVEDLSRGSPLFFCLHLMWLDWPVCFEWSRFYGLEQFQVSEFHHRSGVPTQMEGWLPEFWSELSAWPFDNRLNQNIFAANWKKKGLSFINWWELRYSWDQSKSQLNIISMKLRIRSTGGRNVNFITC